jgi:DNA-binding GntR family transcriptional regulator
MYSTELDNSKSKIEQAYWRIRQDILSGALAPGAKLRIEHLSESYGFGASGIREALSRLLSDGVVESEAQKGYWVAGISREDLRDLTEARKAVEVGALRGAILHGDLAWESRVVAARHMLERFEITISAGSEDEVMAWERANRQFHLALISGCPSRRLIRLTEQYYDQVMRYRHRTTLRRSFPRAGLSEDHKVIVESTLARDTERACAKLTEHIETIARGAEVAIFGPAGE